MTRVSLRGTSHSATYTAAHGARRRGRPQRRPQHRGALPLPERPLARDRHPDALQGHGRLVVPAARADQRARGVEAGRGPARLEPAARARTAARPGGRRDRDPACTYAIDALRNPDAAVAFASAVNDWQIAEWLEKEPRLRASIVVPSQLPR